MCHDFRYDDTAAIVKTDRGEIKGYLYDGVCIFKGVPYAQALRFHAPQPVDPWEGVLDATNYGYVSPLLDLPKPTGELLVPHRFWVMNENCQNLNIWTPKCDGAKRPVLVWLHGGGYEAGSAIEQIAYEGENMCRNGQVVVVSINHRLNILGFLDLSSFGEEYANSGNAGMDDIIAALKWIRENIEKFGGDPDNVTLFGQSGGGGKLTTLLQMPGADGLYTRMISMSGVLEGDLADSPGSGEKIVKEIMKALSIQDVKELENIPYEQLAKAYNEIRPKMQKEGEYVGGCPNPNAYYRGTPFIYGFREETAHVPMVIGSVFGEFASFMPHEYNKSHLTREEEIKIIENVVGKEYAGELIESFEKSYPERHISDVLLMDYMFRIPTKEYISMRSMRNDCTYAYLFNQDMPINGGEVPWHCADIPYIFHNTELVPVTQNGNLTQILEKQIFECAIAFAKTGDPNHAYIPNWSHSTAQNEYTLVFDGNTRVLCDHDKELLPVVSKCIGPVFSERLINSMGNMQH